MIKCPKCNKVLMKTKTYALWCTNGCYINELELREDLKFWGELPKEETDVRKNRR